MAEQKFRAKTLTKQARFVLIGVWAGALKRDDLRAQSVQAAPQPALLRLRRQEHIIMRLLNEGQREVGQPGHILRFHAGGGTPGKGRTDRTGDSRPSAASSC